MDSARWPFPWTVRVILAHVGCLFSIHRTSVCVRQHTQDVRVCVHQHKLDVRGCPSAHTERLWLSINTHIRTLALSVNCLCTDLDMSSSFVDWTVQVSLIDASPSSNELMVQVYLCWLDFSYSHQVFNIFPLVFIVVRSTQAY